MQTLSTRFFAPFSKHLLGVVLSAAALTPAWAGTLTDISFKSNGLGFVNNTLVDGNTSPLAFTDTSSLSAPFLNAADSSLSLGYGNYYAIAFRGFGEHVGAGEVSFRVDGGALITQIVTFPSPASASPVFASFALPGGDMVTVAATGLAADRIRIVADGGGLLPDGTADAYYRFDYISAVPEPLSVVLMAGGLVLIAGASRRAGRVHPGASA